MTDLLRHQTRRDLLEQGLSVDEIRRARRRGELTRLGRGLYVDATGFDDLAVDERHRVRAGALAARNPGLVVSHQSAAALLDLPLLTSPDQVHFTRPGRGGFRRTPEMVVHPGALDETETTVRNGIRLTSAARTVVDVARTASLRPAVVLADAALHSGMVTPAELADALVAAVNRKGRPQAARALSRTNGRSESPGETMLRLTLDVPQLPRLELQIEIRDADDRFVARVDGGYPDHGVLLEFDGLVKYSTLLRPGQSASEVVVAEKRREERISALGWLVIRVVWADLQHPAALIRRVQLACQQRERLTGLLRGTARTAQ